MKQKLFFRIMASIALIAMPVLAIAQEVDPGFNPNKLIEDPIFADTQTFGGPEGIQRFLESKNSLLANTAPDFVAKLKEPDNSVLKQGLDDPQPNLDRLRTAAELIWDSSRASGLNPQVIIVTLQKEQGLITNHHDDPQDKVQKALDHAMGFDCPDSGGCGNLFPGFYYQLFGNFDADNNRYLGAAKSLVKSYSFPNGRGPQLNGHAATIGESITLDNTLGGYTNISAQQTVTLANKATAALYRYTPHVFNGNYNFWKFFNSWFRYPNGTLLRLSGDNVVYIIQNGTKQLVPPFVATARQLNLASALIVSPNEIESYPTDRVFGPTDNTVVKVEGSDQLYVFIANIKKPASPFVLEQRGLPSSAAITMTTAESALFEQGSILTPKDGTVLRGQTEPAIYLVENGVLKLFSPYTFNQKKVAKQVQLIPDTEIASYPKQGFVAPMDGTMIKSASKATTYLVDSGLKHPISAEIFKNRGFSYKNIVTLSDEEVLGLAIGAYTTPKNKTFFAVADKNGPLYIFKEGAKHNISSFVAKQRGITPDYIFSSGESYEWLDGIAIPPRDGTLIKGDDSGTVYLVSKGQLKPLTLQAFKNRKLNFKKVKTLVQTEVDSYAKGDTISK